LPRLINRSLVLHLANNERNSLMPKVKSPDAKSSNVVVLKNGGSPSGSKRLPRFIDENVELIVGEWEAFARTLTPSSDGMTPLALRDHIHQILAFIVPDIEASQSPEQQRSKSHGIEDETNTAAQTHAALRFAGGFDIGQMASEYRALRASILKLWKNTNPALDAQDIDDITRFNESIDQELAESVNFYTKKVAHSKDLLVGILGHDLRSPVQAIVLSAELAIHMGKMSDSQTMLIKNVLESAERMGALVTNILDVTRARFGGGLPVVRTMMNMGFVARQIVDEVHVVNPSRTIELSLSGNLVGEWDKARIGQVFSNLLSNAIQYGFRGSPIRVDVTGGPESVTLAVGNDGVPITSEKMDIIFDPLTRGLPAESSLPASGNLGLAALIQRGDARVGV
jgi:signal transduction histidine kinase